MTTTRPAGPAWVVSSTAPLYVSRVRMPRVLFHYPFIGRVAGVIAGALVLAAETVPRSTLLPDLGVLAHLCVAVVVGWICAESVSGYFRDRLDARVAAWTLVKVSGKPAALAAAAAQMARRIEAPSTADVREQGWQALLAARVLFDQAEAMRKTKESLALGQATGLDDADTRAKTQAIVDEHDRAVHDLIATMGAIAAPAQASGR